MFILTFRCVENAAQALWVLVIAFEVIATNPPPPITNATQSVTKK
jgi:hypothetical protein